MSKSNYIVDVVIPSLDDKCKRCFRGDTMLCSGMRLFLNEEMSERYGYPVTQTSPCSKLEAKLDQELVDKAVHESGIPQQFLDTYERKEVYMPKFLYSKFSDDLRNDLWAHGVNLLNAGTSYKYILTQLLLKRFGEWDSLIEKLGERYKVLVLDRFDLGNAPDIGLDELGELVRYRYNRGLSTLITVGEYPRMRCTSEVSLYTFMESWNENRKD